MCDGILRLKNQSRKPQYFLLPAQKHAEDVGIDLLYFIGFHLAFTVPTGDMKLFEDPDLGGTVSLGDSLLLPNAYQKTEAPAVTRLDEDVDDLFRSVLVSTSLSYKTLNSLCPRVRDKTDNNPKIATENHITPKLLFCYVCADATPLYKGIDLRSGCLACFVFEN